MLILSNSNALIAKKARLGKRRQEEEEEEKKKKSNSGS